ERVGELGPHDEGLVAVRPRGRLDVHDVADPAGVTGGGQPRHHRGGDGQRDRVGPGGGAAGADRGAEDVVAGGRIGDPAGRVGCVLDRHAAGDRARTDRGVPGLGGLVAADGYPAAAGRVLELDLVVPVDHRAAGVVTVRGGDRAGDGEDRARVGQV